MPPLGDVAGPSSDSLSSVSPPAASGSGSGTASGSGTTATGSVPPGTYTSCVSVMSSGEEMPFEPNALITSTSTSYRAAMSLSVSPYRTSCKMPLPAGMMIDCPSVSRSESWISALFAMMYSDVMPKRSAIALTVSPSCTW
jgi:hypothetical protein